MTRTKGLLVVGAALALTCHGCGDGGAETRTEPSALVVPDGVPPCFPDDGPIAFYVDGVPVPEKTIARLVAFVRAAQPGTPAEQAQAHVVRKAAIPIAAAYAAGLKPGAAGEEPPTAAVARKAAEAAARIASGEDFAVVASELSDDPGTKNKGGALGPALRARFEQIVLGELIFATEVGKTAGPVFTVFGAHLVRVAEKSDGAGPELDTRAAAHILCAYGGEAAIKDAAGLKKTHEALEASARVVLVNEAFKKSVPLEFRK